SYSYNVNNWIKYTSSNTVVNTGLTVNGAVTDSATITTSADPRPFVSAGMSIRITGIDYLVNSVTATDIILHSRVQTIANAEPIYVTSYLNDPFVDARPFYEIR